MATAALKKIMKASELKGIIDLPEEWKNKNLSIYVAPVDLQCASADISSYFGSVKIDDPDRCARNLRAEWDRV